MGPCHPARRACLLALVAPDATQVNYGYGHASPRAACSGTGSPIGKIRFLAGTRLPDLAAKSPPECSTCKGDGYVYVRSEQHP
jgi:hypothetical protein